MDDYGIVEIVTYVTVLVGMSQRRPARRRILLARFSCTRQNFRGLVDEALEIIREADTTGSLGAAVIESAFTPDRELYTPGINS